MATGGGTQLHDVRLPCPACGYPVELDGPGLCAECGRGWESEGLREYWARQYERARALQRDLVRSGCMFGFAGGVALGLMALGGGGSWVEMVVAVLCGLAGVACGVGARLLQRPIARWVMGPWRPSVHLSIAVGGVTVVGTTLGLLALLAGLTSLVLWGAGY